jgi:hypothetical protein
MSRRHDRTKPHEHSSHLPAEVTNIFEGDNDDVKPDASLDELPAGYGGSFSRCGACDAVMIGESKACPRGCNKALPDSAPIAASRTYEQRDVASVTPWR